MNRTTVVAMAIGLAVAALLVGLIVLKQSGSTPRLEGEITSVRTLGMDRASAVALVDFRFTNNSRYQFIVQSTAMSVVDAKGNVYEGAVVAARDADELFRLFPAIGAKTADTLIIKTRVEPRASRTAMLSARFEIPKAALDARSRIAVAITEIDGAVSEIAQPAAR
jgi:hypothetical protein